MAAADNAAPEAGQHRGPRKGRYVTGAIFSFTRWILAMVSVGVEKANPIDEDARMAI
jgi:hypothetical protein